MKTSMWVHIGGVGVTPPTRHRRWRRGGTEVRVNDKITMYMGEGAVAARGAIGCRVESRRREIYLALVLTNVAPATPMKKRSTQSSARFRGRPLNSVGVIRDGDDGVLSGASCPIRVALLISCSQRSSLTRNCRALGWA